jgi:hypothetical protein
MHSMTFRTYPHRFAEPLPEEGAWHKAQTIPFPALLQAEKKHSYRQETGRHIHGTCRPVKEALIKSLSNFILAF